MLDIIVDGLSRMTAEEWQERCRKSDEEEDRELQNRYQKLYEGNASSGD
jgi:hypothetical protein